MYDEIVFDENSEMYIEEQICVDDIAVGDVGEYVQVEGQGLVPVQRLQRVRFQVLLKLDILVIPFLTLTFCLH